MISTKSKEQTFLLSLNNLSFSYRYKPVLKNISLKIKAGQHWVFLGRNGAGKSSLAAILGGRETSFSGTYELAPDLKKRGIEIVSFEETRTLRSRERKLDLSEFNETAFDPGTSVRELLAFTNIDSDEASRWITLIGIDSILDRGVRFISTGQMRKVLLAKAILKRPGMIILDNLTDGLDISSQKSMRNLLDDLINQDWLLVVLSRQLEDVPKKSTHVMVLENGIAIQSGKKELVLSDSSVSNLMETPSINFGKLPPISHSETMQSIEGPLLSLKNVSVRYGDLQIFKNVNWEFRHGQHCHIYGPNGCGKTTLLSLILGDNQKAYGQNIHIFGKLRGSGESIWDIKQKFGQVGTELHLDFIGGMTNLEVILSGFFDTIGLYTAHDDYQKRHSLKWLEVFQLEDLAKKQFDELSFGTQRVILIARAMVKYPAVLILDEPTLGMDLYNQKLILSAIDHIAENSQTQIIFISHSQGERPNCINQELYFKSSNKIFSVSVTEN